MEIDALAQSLRTPKLDTVDRITKQVHKTLRVTTANEAGEGLCGEVNAEVFRLLVG